MLLLLFHVGLEFCFAVVSTGKWLTRWWYGW